MIQESWRFKPNRCNFYFIHFWILKRQASITLKQCPTGEYAFIFTRTSNRRLDTGQVLVAPGLLANPGKPCQILADGCAPLQWQTTCWVVVYKSYRYVYSYIKESNEIINYCTQWDLLEHWIEEGTGKECQLMTQHGSIHQNIARLTHGTSLQPKRHDSGLDQQQLTMGFHMEIR